MTQLPKVHTSAAHIRFDPAAPLPPQPFANQWTLVRSVGQGQHSRVYQARPRGCDASRPSDYCIKTLRDEHDAEGLRLLRREASVASQVAHPNLLTVLAAEVDRPPYYLTLPFLEGMTLEDALTGHAPLPIPMALWLTRQAAQALAALHDCQWMHGDIKPTNLQISPQGHLTVLDLGLARKIGSLECAAEGPLMGTLAYAAPESFSAALPANDRSDVYSLGVTLYRALSGRLPFEGDDAELCVAHLRHRPPEVRELVPRLPNRVARLAHRLLAKEPLRRPAAAELVDILVTLEVDALVEHAA